MKRVLVILQNYETKPALQRKLAYHDLSCSFTSYNNGISKVISYSQPDILLLEMAAGSTASQTLELVSKSPKGRSLPVIALIPKEMLHNTNLLLSTADFITTPYDSKEVMLRINRLLQRTGAAKGKEKIICDSLIIDTVTCEVTLAGQIVELTFKEYELLKLLAANPGHVYTRQDLLDKIWGYDYFGGDRTVDVHVRRLRSKIEDAGHTFIETVRNIGYRFIKNH